jgi:hypothetical protein
MTGFVIANFRAGNDPSLSLVAVESRLSQSSQRHDWK